MVTLRRYGSRITRSILALILLAAACCAAGGAYDASSEPAETYGMVFPVAGNHSYVDTFGAPRSGGRSHKGTDIFADKRTPVVSVADGVVEKVALGDLAGRYIAVQHHDGWRSLYIHLDNDSPGTDDGLGGAPAPGIEAGVRVRAGDVLDYVGDSGNAEGTSPHLHFELHTPDGTALNPYPHLRAAEAPKTDEPQPAEVIDADATASVAPPPETAPEAEPEYDRSNVDVVGALSLGDGFAAGVAVHEAVAYVGTWGRRTACPSAGVRLIDITDPAAPQLLTSIASGDEYPGTSTESMWVGSVATPTFTGDLAVVGVRRCDTTERARSRDGFRGIAAYDVSDPTDPVLLGRITSGERTQGVHQLDVALTDDDGIVVAATVMQSYLHTDGQVGDVQLFDLSDPEAPIARGDWDLRRDGPVKVVASLLEGRDPVELHAHSLQFADGGRTLWVGNWDAGVVQLDVADRDEPTMVRLIGFDPATEGNAHSVVYDADAGLLIRSDEDLHPDAIGGHVAGWGGQRIYEARDPDRLVEVARINTANSAPSGDDGVTRTDGYYSAHEAVLSEGLEYVAWYSDGVRIFDLGNLEEPTEIGYFVPPPRADPQGYWNAPNGERAFAMVWGVALAGDLIVASDMHTGLWILRYVDDAGAAREPGMR